MGRWTAEYVLLRGLGRVLVFPGDDVGARNNLKRWLHLAGPLDYEGVGAIQAGWGGFAGLVYFHLLLDRLFDRCGIVVRAPVRTVSAGDPFPITPITVSWRGSL